MACCIRRSAWHLLAASPPSLFLWLSPGISRPFILLLSVSPMFCPGCNLCLVFLSCVRPFWCVMSASALVRTNCAPPRVFIVYLLNLCKFFIWQSRNDFRFRHVPPGAIDVIPKVKARLKCHLRLLQTFPVFSPPSVGRHRQWGARGVVPSVSGNRFAIAL